MISQKKTFFSSTLVNGCYGQATFDILVHITNSTPFEVVPICNSQCIHNLLMYSWNWDLASSKPITV